MGRPRRWEDQEPELEEKGEESPRRQKERVKEGKRRKEGTAMQGEEETLGSGVPQQEREKGESKKKEERGRSERRGSKWIRRDSKLTEMEPGKKRDLSVVRDMKGMERGMSKSATRSSPMKRRSSPSSSPRGSSKASRMTEALDKNRNSLPSAGRETDGDWADQVEQESKEEGRERDRERIREVREELRRHPATAPPSVCRVRTLYACEDEDEAFLSFKPGSIITRVWPSESREEWLVGTLEGKKGFVSPDLVEILD